MVSESSISPQCTSCGATLVSFDEPLTRCPFCGAAVQDALATDATEVPRVAMILAGAVVGGLAGATVGFFFGVNPLVSGIVGMLPGAIVGLFSSPATP